jgi:indole-3-glycerol phosphate synthase
MLERIARVKVDEVRLLKAELDINNITPKREIPNIFDYLSAPDRSLRVIAEVKKASPLKGVLCPDFHPGSWPVFTSRMGRRLFQ